MARAVSSARPGDAHAVRDTIPVRAGLAYRIDTMRLFLTRHAKSDWSDPRRPDHDRPLNARGIGAAAAMGRWIAGRSHLPDLVLLSTAMRVSQTWDGISPHLPDGLPVQTQAELYLATPETILDVLSRQTAQCVMVVAHNPGIAALAQWLVLETPKRVEFHRFPTGATLILDIEGSDWASLSARSADVVDFTVPRDLVD